MKTWFLALLLLTTGLAISQVPTTPVVRFPGPAQVLQQGEGLLENYVLTLTVRENETVKTTLSLLVSGNNFSASFPASPDSFASFTGTLSSDENGTVALKYSLGAEIHGPAEGGQPQVKSVSFSATVRLQPGKAVEIMNLNHGSAELRLTKAAEATKAH